MDAETLAAVFMTIRAQRDALEAEYERADAELKQDMDKLEAAMLSLCNEMKADSIKTQYGLIMRSLKERYICGDWDSFRKFEVDNPEYDFRERRISQSNFKQFLTERKADGLPPGVSVMREFAITVRKPSK